MTLDQFGNVTLKWDPKNLEIRTMSVERTLEPLVIQVRGEKELGLFLVTVLDCSFLS